MISGIITGLLMAAFFAIGYWAYSARNRARWEQIAQSPLLDDTTPPCCRKASTVNSDGGKAP